LQNVSKMNNAKFIIFDDKYNDGWFLGSNTNNKFKIKKFLAFLSETCIKVFQTMIKIVIN